MEDCFRDTLTNNIYIDKNYFYSVKKRFDSFIPRCDYMENTRDCLNNINSTQQNWWSEFLIFDHIRSCYKKDHPIIECLDFDHRLNNSQLRCVNYKLDESQSKRYQLFDVPYFYNSKDPNISRFVNQIYDELNPRFPSRLREIPIELKQKNVVQ